MKKTLWSTVVLFFSGVSCLWAGSPSMHSLCRYFGFGWGKGYHAQCEPQWYAPVYGVWEQECCDPYHAGIHHPSIGPTETNRQSENPLPAQSQPVTRTEPRVAEPRSAPPQLPAPRTASWPTSYPRVNSGF